MKNRGQQKCLDKALLKELNLFFIPFLLLEVLQNVWWRHLPFSCFYVCSSIFFFFLTMFLWLEGHQKSLSQVHLLQFGERFSIDFATEECNVLTCFNFENTLSRLALLMGVVNRTLFKGKMFFHVVHLGEVKIQCQQTR